MKPVSEERLRGLAEEFIAVMRSELGVELRYDEASVEWVDGYVGRVRAGVSADSVGSISSLIGSFLGECVINNYGGSWRETGDGVGVCFDESNCVFPFAKVHKQFLHGEGDSILSFYRTIGIVFKDLINAQ
ncbi:MAG TPA: hypothetical protein VM864_06450 [Pyrinomonadaceae bacterium]|jgi:hypothetical protein|nr:hypothetical protein [Pyrinomonadaceae bacterium]